jgi:hypothetical protein
MTPWRQWSTIAAGAVVALISVPAGAQTWVGPRTTPILDDIVAVDDTGEPGWPFGFEDLDGDGMTFAPREQAIDFRTVYAATDATRFWVRTYVSAPDAVGPAVTVYVFVDADGNPATGGSAAATEIDAKFTPPDPTAGGYEYVIEISANGTVPRIWQWQTAQMTFTSQAPMTKQAVGEAGHDIDPILLDGNEHGYVQAAVDLTLVGLTQACVANLFVRSTNNAPWSAGDLDVGKEEPCTPALDGDGIPTVVVPAGQCTTSAECPAGGICVSGTCIIAVSCSTNADCPAGDQCTPDGRCVPIPAGSCTTNATCGDLVCLGGVCSACPLGGAQCGAGEVCAPNGKCVVGTELGTRTESPFGAVEGGAFACTLSSDGGGTRGRAAALAALAWIVAPLLLAWRRRARSRGGEPHPPAKPPSERPRDVR